MKTEAEIKMQGMRALISTLGTVEAERFIVAISRDKFDYTKLRRDGLPKLEINEIAQKANKLTKKLNAKN